MEKNDKYYVDSAKVNPKAVLGFEYTKMLILCEA